MSEPLDIIGDAEPRLRDALERVRPRMARLEKDRLSSVNLEPFVAAAVVRGVIPGLLPLRKDLLETYAFALLQAETLYQAVTARSKAMAALLREGFALRERLVADAHSLAERGLLPKPQLSKLTVPNGYRNIGADLLSLSTLLRGSWPTIASNTPITLAELDRAETMAEQLLAAIASRQRRSVAANAAADDRKRAFTLMVNAYDEVRCAILYLRRHVGDADRITPSLYRKTKGRRAKAKTTASDANNTVVEPKACPTVVLEPLEDPKVPSLQQATRTITDPFIH